MERIGFGGRLIVGLALMLALVLVAPGRPQAAPDAASPDPTLGIAHKRPVFGGACKSCPWGAMADVVKAALKPYGYDVQAGRDPPSLQVSRMIR